MSVRLNTCHTPFSLVNTRTVRGCKRALESPTVSKSPSLRVRLNNASLHAVTAEATNLQRM